METLLQAFKTRRTNYVLGKDVTVPDDTIIAMIQDIVREVPSAFNMQSGRVVIALGAKHDAIWQITMDTLRAIVPEEAFGRTEEKIKSFALLMKRFKKNLTFHRRGSSSDRCHLATSSSQPMLYLRNPLKNGFW